MKDRKIESGVITHSELMLYTDYFNSVADRHFIVNVETKRGDQYSARMIDEDGEDWYIIKQLFNGRYKRLKRESVTKLEVIEIK